MLPGRELFFVSGNPINLEHYAEFGGTLKRREQLLKRSAKSESTRFHTGFIGSRAFDFQKLILEYDVQPFWQKTLTGNRIGNQRRKILVRTGQSLLH